MKKIFSIFAMAAMVLASCVKEQAPALDGDQNGVEPSGNLVEKVFSVGDPESKTYIDGTIANGKIVINWDADDAISVWDGVANRKFTMVGEPNGASATFKGLVDADATDFYAIYPYDENLQYSYDEANQRMVFTVTKPAVQYANPEGGLADGSAYACGKADENGNIKFVNRSALLKFSLANGMKVKSLKISGNEDDDILAGTLDFRYKDNNFSAGWKSAGKSTEITFCNEDGSNLKTGVDYYLSMIGNTFGKGYAITLTFEDGTSVIRDSDKAIQYMSNQIYPLASKPLSRTTFGATYYEAYEAGEDIMIAGKAYNKATYGDAVLVAADATYEITGTSLVCFIEPGANVTYKPSNSVSKMIIIGNNPGVKSSMTQSVHYKVATDGVLAVMNLSVNTEALTGSNYLFNIYGTNTPKSFALDNCSMTFNNKHLIYHAKDTFVSEVSIHNCDIKFTVKDNDLWLFNVNSAAPSIKLMDFQNNVLWHDSKFNDGKGFRITNGSSATVEKFIFRNNTLVNLTTRKNSASFVSFKINEAEIFNNLIYSPDQAVDASFMQQACTNSTSLNNYYYTGNDYKVSGWSFAAASTIPFTAINTNNGTFVKADAYKNYGAKR